MTTPQQRPPPQPDHDLGLPYQDEILPGSAIDPARWDWWSHTHGGIVHYYAKGPCPACRANTQDHFADLLAPIEGLGIPSRVTRARRPARGRETLRPAPPAGVPETVEMPVRCCCGSDHGQPGEGYRYGGHGLVSRSSRLRSGRIVPAG